MEDSNDFFRATSDESPPFSFLLDDEFKPTLDPMNMQGIMTPSITPTICTPTARPTPDNASGQMHHVAWDISFDDLPNGFSPGGYQISGHKRDTTDTAAYQPSSKRQKQSGPSLTGQCGTSAKKRGSKAFDLKNCIRFFGYDLGDTKLTKKFSSNQDFSDQPFVRLVGNDKCEADNTWVVRAMLLGGRKSKLQLGKVHESGEGGIFGRDEVLQCAIMDGTGRPGEQWYIFKTSPDEKKL